MPRLKRRLLSLLMVVGSCALSARVVTAQAVKIDATKSVIICGDCTPREARFPVSAPEGKRLPNVDISQPAILELTVDQIQDLDRKSYFAPRWEKTKNGQPLALIVTVKDLRLPGAYALLLDLLPGEPQPTRDIVTITVPEAMLSVPSKLEIARTVRWPWTFPGGAEWVHDDPLPLVVRETAARVSILTIAGETSTLSVSDKAIGGRIDVVPATPDPKVSAKPHVPSDGGPVTVPYKLSGEFPLGTAVGQLQLRASELKSIVLIPVEVHTKLSKWYLLLAIVLGLVISWLVKVRLAQWLQLKQARVLATKLLGDVARDMARYGEPGFRAAIGDAWNALGVGLNGREPAPLDALRVALDTAWRAAVQRAEADRADYQAKAERFEQLVGRDWPLPPVLADAIAAARATARNCATDARPNLDSRRAGLTNAQNALGEALQTTGRAWHVETLAAFAAIPSADSAKGLPAAVAAALASALSGWGTAYPTPLAPPAVMEADALEATLRSIAGLRLAANEAVRTVAESLRRAVADAEFELRKVSAVLPGVRAHVAQVIAALEALVDDPGQTNAALDALRSLDPAWRDDFRPVFDQTTDPAAQTLVRADLDAQQFVKAARDIARAIQKAHAAAQNRPFLGGGTPPQEPAPSAEPVVSLPAPSIPLLESLVMRALRLPFVPVPFESLLLRSQADLNVAKGVQSVALGLLLVASALATYAPQWDGTWTGLFTVFFGAFSIDIATDSILTKLKG